MSIDLHTSSGTAIHREIDLATRRRAEILYGAIRVIARDGVAAAKLKDIARESGVSLGLIQHYFDTRENLIDAAFVAMMQVVSSETIARMGSVTDPLRVILEANRLHAYGTVSFPERWGFWSELWAGSGRSTHIGNVARQVYELWARPIEDALTRLKEQQRLPETADPSTLTIGLLALMDGLAVRTLAASENFTNDVMLEILNEWTIAQLGVDPQEARKMLEQLNREQRLPKSSTLSPDVIAATLVENEN